MKRRRRKVAELIRQEGENVIEEIHKIKWKVWRSLYKILTTLIRNEFGEYSSRTIDDYHYSFKSNQLDQQISKS